jgi:hypothetical protein
VLLGRGDNFGATVMPGLPGQKANGYNQDNEGYDNNNVTEEIHESPLFLTPISIRAKGLCQGQKP